MKPNTTSSLFSLQTNADVYKIRQAFDLVVDVVKDLDILPEKVAAIEVAIGNAADRVVAYNKRADLVRLNAQYENQAHLLMHRMTREKHQLIKGKRSLPSTMYFVRQPFTEPN
jgi:hypothetical protein